MFHTWNSRVYLLFNYFNNIIQILTRKSNFRKKMYVISKHMICRVIYSIFKHKDLNTTKILICSLLTHFKLKKKKSIFAHNLIKKIQNFSKNDWITFYFYNSINKLFCFQAKSNLISYEYLWWLSIFQWKWTPSILNNIKEFYYVGSYIFAEKVPF